MGVSHTIFGKYAARAAIMSLSVVVCLLGIVGAFRPKHAAARTPNLAEQLCTVINHQVTADDARIVFSSYQGDYADRARGGIYSIPLVGGNIDKINNSVTDNNLNSDFLLSDDGRFAVYLAGDTMYSTAVDGGQSVELATHVASMDDIALSSDGQTIAYVADVDDDGRNELYVVPTLGGQIVPLIQDGDVAWFKYAGETNTLVLLNQSDASLYSVSLEGTPAVKISDSAETNISSIIVAPNGQRVLYRAVAADANTLVSVTVDGTDRQVVADIGQATFAQIALSPDSQRAVFLVEESDVFQLFSAELSGGETTQLNGDLPAGASLINTPIEISADSSFVIYLANQDDVDVVELYEAPLAGGAVTKLNAELVAGGNVGGDEQTIAISPNGQYVYYVADQLRDEQFELFSVRRASGQVVKLNPEMRSAGDVAAVNGSPDGLLVTPDSNFVVFSIRPNSAEDEIQLHSASSTGGWITQLNDELHDSGLSPIFIIPRVTGDSGSVITLSAYGTDADTILRYTLRSESPMGEDATEIIECAVGLGLANHMLIVDSDSFRDYDWQSRSLINSISTDGHATYSRVGSRLLLNDLSSTNTYSWPLLQLEKSQATEGRGFIRFIDDEKLLLIDDSSLKKVSWPDLEVQSAAETSGRPSYHFAGDRILLVDEAGISQYFWPGLQADGNIASVGKPSIKFVSADQLLVLDNTSVRIVEWPSLDTLFSAESDGQATLRFVSADEVLVSDNSELRKLTWPGLEEVVTIPTSGFAKTQFSGDYLIATDDDALHLLEWPSMDIVKMLSIAGIVDLTFASNELLLVTSAETVQLMSWPALEVQQSITTQGQVDMQFVNNTTVLLIDDASLATYSWPTMELLHSQPTDGRANVRFSGSDAIIAIDASSIQHRDFPALTLRNHISTTGMPTFQFITADSFIVKDEVSLQHYSWPSMTTENIAIAISGQSDFERIGDRLVVTDEQSLRIYRYAELENELTLATSGQAGYRIVNDQMIVLDSEQLTILDWESLTTIDQQTTSGQAIACVYSPIANCLEVPDVYAPIFVTKSDTTDSAIIAPFQGEQISGKDVQFNWHPASDIAAVTYEVEITGLLENGESFSKVVETEHSFYLPELDLENGTYSWRVRAVDGNQNVTEWLPAQQFNVHTYEVFLPIVINPADS